MDLLGANCDSPPAAGCLNGLPLLERPPISGRTPGPEEPEREGVPLGCGVAEAELLGWSSCTVLGMLWCAAPGWLRCSRVGDRTRLPEAKPAFRECVREATESPKGLVWLLPWQACWGSLGSAP